MAVRFKTGLLKRKKRRIRWRWS